MNKLQIVDKPSRRRVHQTVVPRGGGIVLVILYSIILPIFEYSTAGGIVYSYDILKIFLPISLVSFWDDLIGINIGFRLFIHIIASIIAIMWLVHPHLILHSDLPIIIDLIIGSFALVTFLNIYNFMDGIDGITGAQTVHLSICLILLSALKVNEVHNIGFIISTAFIILGWSLAFLLFNWHPASIFLGDVGSIGAGFLLGICFLILGSSSAHLFLASVIACLYYIADGGVTLLIRLAGREKIWQPHLKHFFHKAARRGVKHNEIVFKIIKCNLFLMLCSIYSLYYPIISTILAVIMVGYTLLRLSGRK